MNSNNSIIKSNNSAKSGSIESRLRKLEQIFQGLTQIIEGGAANNTINNTQNISGSLKNLLPLLSNEHNSQGATGQIMINPTANSGNIQNGSSKQLSLSQGQIIAELAAAIMKANQRNS